MKKNEGTVRTILRSLEIPLFFPLPAAKAEEETVQEKGILRRAATAKTQRCTLFILCKKPIHLVTTRTRLFGHGD